MHLLHMAFFVVFVLLIVFLSLHIIICMFIYVFEFFALFINTLLFILLLHLTFNILIKEVRLFIIMVDWLIFGV